MEKKMLLGLVYLLLAFPISFAQIQYYGIDAYILDGASTEIKLTITFADAVKEFDLTFFGRIENFVADSNAGPVNCEIEVREASLISCEMNLSRERRTLELIFQTPDLVKALDRKFYFNGDFSLGQDIEQVFVSIKLSEGLALVKDARERTILPENAITISDGRRIIAIWRLSEIKANEPLRFKLIYERVGMIGWLEAQLIKIALVVGAISVGLAIALAWHIKRSKRLVLSVLNEFERKIMDILIESKGVVKQRKVVRETNLSKATVSRVVKSLERRGLLEVERRGRTNILRFPRKKFKFF